MFVGRINRFFTERIYCLDSGAAPRRCMVCVVAQDKLPGREIVGEWQQGEMHSDYDVNRAPGRVGGFLHTRDKSPGQYTRWSHQGKETYKSRSMANIMAQHAPAGSTAGIV